MVKRFGTSHKLIYLKTALLTQQKIQRGNKQNRRPKRFHFLRRTKYSKEKYTKPYKDSKDKNTKTRNFCRTKKCFKKCIKAVLQKKWFINTFINEDVYSGNVERDVYYTPKVLQLKWKFEDSRVERTKIRRQKFDEENHEEQGLKTLTPDQMPCRLQVTSRLHN